MRKVAIKAALLSSVVAIGVALAAPAGAASTLRRLKNADTTYGYYYLGIPPGPQNGFVTEDANLVVWQFSQEDQLWYVPQDDGFGQFQNYYNSANSPVCLSVTGTGNGYPVIDQACNEENPNQYWQLISSSKVGKDSEYPGCYVLWNITTGKAIGVTNGYVANGGTVVQWDYDGTANQFWCPN